MAKHTKKSAGKRIWNLVIFGLALCAAASVATGAVLASHGERVVSQGNLLPTELILKEQQTMVAQPNGGFLLVTSNGTTETNAMFLTQDGAVADGSANYRSILGGLEQVFVQDNTAYITASSKVDTRKTGVILQIPLDGSQFTNASEVVFDNTALQIDLSTLCVDTAGDCYGISRSKNQILHLDLTNMERTAAVSIPLENSVTLQGMEVADEILYLSGTDANGVKSIWMGTLFQDKVLSLTRQSNTTISFPITFLNKTTVLDAENRLYTIAQGNFTAIAGMPSFSGDVDMDDSGMVAGICAENEIALYKTKDDTTPIGTFLYDGEICTLAFHDGVGAVLYKDNRYHGILLDDADFGLEETEPFSSKSEDIPINQEPSGDGASFPEDMEPVTDRIFSSTYNVDSAAGTVTLPAGTTFAQFRKTVPCDGLTLLAANAVGESISGGKLGTGMRLQLFGGEEMLDEIVVIVKGDLNGNGVVNSADERLLYQHLTEEHLLEEYPYMAADLDENNEVNTRDLLLLKQRYQ